jgi:cytochrome c-type biogenesis protein
MGGAVTAAIHADPLGLLVAFGAGMLSFLSPCVLPLVPGYVSMVSGLSAAELAGIEREAPRGRAAVPVGAAVGASVGASAGSGVGVVPSRESLSEESLSEESLSEESLSEESLSDGSSGPAAKTAEGRRLEPRAARAVRARLLRGILAFIAGFTVVFVILGAASSALGRLFLTHQRALETASGVLIVLFGAVLVWMAAGGTLPLAFARERRVAVRPSVLGAWAPPVMGMAFAFAWTPCIGPVLGSVLALAAGTGGSATGGIVLLVAYSLGLGVPFLLCGLAFGQMTVVLGKVRRRLRWIDLAGGVVLVVFGLVLLTGQVDVIAAHLSTWLRDLHLGRLSSS